MKTVETMPWVGETRRENGLVELVCKCGVGHPAPGSVHWMKLHGKEMMDVHGCCGCCQTPEWKLAAAIASYEKANELLKDTLTKYKQAAGMYLFLRMSIERIRRKSKAIREILAEADKL